MAKFKRVRRVIVHAGLPKTATTTIQNACFAERSALLEQHGILYPGHEPNHTNALCTAFLTNPANHITNKLAGLSNPDELANIAASIRDRLVEEIKAAAPETVLLSAEGLSNLHATELKVFNDWLLDFADAVQVVYIVRNPLSYTASVIQQHLKAGEVLEDIYEHLPLPHFKGRLGGAVRAFGQENVGCYCFETLCDHPNGIVGAFLDLIGIKEGSVRAAILDRARSDNPSLSHEAALLLSSINRQRPAFVNGRRGPRRAFKELPVIQSIRGIKFYLPREIEIQVLEQSRDDVEWLRNNFGITEYDSLELAPPSVPHATLSKETIDSLAIVLSNLINERHVNALLQRARALRKQGKYEELGPIAAEIQRINPDRPLPSFLAKVTEMPDRSG